MMDLAAHSEKFVEDPAPTPDQLDSAITALGYQPFLAVNIVGKGGERPLLCPTQNEASSFGASLLSLGERSDFLLGLCAALGQDQAGAVDHIAAWLKRGDQQVTIRFDLPTVATALFPHCVGYPLIRLYTTREAIAPTGEAERVAALSGFVRAFADAAGNDLLRQSVCDAFTRALAAHREPSAADGPAMSPPRASAAELVYQRIREIRHQPLFALLIAEAGRTMQVLTCRSSSDVAEFIRDVRAARSFSRCRFLQGFVAALEHETFDSAVSWFDWIEDPEDPFTLVGEFVDAATPSFPNPNGYPLLYLFERDARTDAGADPLAKGELLGRIFAAFEAPAGNEAVRDKVLEGMALALSKHLGHHAHFREALTFVKCVLRHMPRSIHLKAAENALDRRLVGEPVPDRLVKFIGRDNGALRERICSKPFQRLDISTSGAALVCCGHLVPTSIGNIMTDAVDDVINSPTAQRIRASTVDGSFKYCNHLECKWMIQDVLPRHDEVTNAAMRAAIDHGRFTVDGVDEMLFAFDRTCNLSCPSCRTHRVTEKPSENEAKADAIERTLAPLLPGLKTLYINSAGEFLASKPSRRLLELIDRETSPVLKIELISNGTLFSPSEWAKFPNIHEIVRAVRISVDACTKETFESLRRLGKFDGFCRNMEFLAGLRAAGIIPALKFSFTYQLGNFAEMVDFVRFARGYNCDFAMFERLMNLGAFTDAEFRERAVHLGDHPRHQEFLAVIRDPIFRQVHVWHDFEWPGTTIHHTVADRLNWNRDAYTLGNDTAGESFITAGV